MRDNNVDEARNFIDQLTAESPRSPPIRGSRKSAANLPGGSATKTAVAKRLPPPWTAAINRSDTMPDNDALAQARSWR